MNSKIFLIIPQRSYCASKSTTFVPFNQRVRLPYTLKYHTVEEMLRYKGPKYRLHPEKAMYKLLFRDHSKKQGIFKILPVGAPSISLEMAVKSANNYRIAESKRVLMFNKILIQHISEILCTSEIGFKLWDYNIQFTSVKISADFANANVYWIPEGTDQDKIVQELLNEVAHPLRSELIKLKVVGLVPRIHFVKDKYHAFMTEVDKRLKIADYGENHIRLLDPSTHIAKDLQLQISLPPELKEKIVDFENSELPVPEDEIMPPMSLSVFGLQYETILAHVNDGIKRARILDTVDERESAISNDSNNQVDSQLFETWNKKAFKAFLKNQKKKEKILFKNNCKEYGQFYLIMEENKKIMENMNRFHENDEQLFSEFIENAFPDIEDKSEDDEISAVQ